MEINIQKYVHRRDKTHLNRYKSKEKPIKTVSIKPGCVFVPGGAAAFVDGCRLKGYLRLLRAQKFIYYDRTIQPIITDMR